MICLTNINTVIIRYRPPISSKSGDLAEYKYYKYRQIQVLEILDDKASKECQQA